MDIKYEQEAILSSSPVRNDGEEAEEIASLGET